MPRGVPVASRSISAQAVSASAMSASSVRRPSAEREPDSRAAATPAAIAATGQRVSTSATSATPPIVATRAGVGISRGRDGRPLPHRDAGQPRRREQATADDEEPAEQGEPGHQPPPSRWSAGS